MDHWLLDATLPLVTFGAVCPKYSKTCSVTRSWELHCSSKFYSDQDLSTLVAMNGHSPTSRFWTSNKYNTISQRELNTHDHATVLHAVCATQHWMILIFLKAWVHQMANIYHISSHQVFEVKYESCTTVLLNYKNHRMHQWSFPRSLYYSKAQYIHSTIFTWFFVDTSWSTFLSPGRMNKDYSLQHSKVTIK